MQQHDEMYSRSRSSVASSVQTEALYLLKLACALCLCVCVCISLCHVVGGLMTTRWCVNHWLLCACCVFKHIFTHVHLTAFRHHHNCRRHHRHHHRHTEFTINYSCTRERVREREGKKHIELHAKRLIPFSSRFHV